MCQFWGEDASFHLELILQPAGMKTTSHDQGEHPPRSTSPKEFRGPPGPNLKRYNFLKLFFILKFN